MPTLNEIIAERTARYDRLKAAIAQGQNFEAEKDSVLEFEHAFLLLLDRNLEAILALAGQIEMGPLLTGISLSHTETFVKEPDATKN